MVPQIRSSSEMDLKWISKFSQKYNRGCACPFLKMGGGGYAWFSICASAFLRIWTYAPDRGSSVTASGFNIGIEILLNWKPSKHVDLGPCCWYCLPTKLCSTGILLSDMFVIHWISCAHYFISMYLINDCAGLVLFIDTEWWFEKNYLTQYGFVFDFPSYDVC